ncbi:MAG: hypothetical protein ACHQJ4_03010 [Ignavibacteria bacterium]
MLPFTGWENFYIIIGSSAGALIGLQFVVLTLVAQMPSGGDAQASSAFATPSVVHFCVVLLLSAIVSIPWNGITIVSSLWGLVGLCGLIYTVIIVRRMRKQTAYKPVFEDWLFHVLLPLLSYVMISISSLMTLNNTHRALYLVGAASLILLFVGIHNAWDAITYHVFTRSIAKRKRREINCYFLCQRHPFGKVVAIF